MTVHLLIEDIEENTNYNKTNYETDIVRLNTVLYVYHEIV